MRAKMSDGQEVTLAPDEAIISEKADGSTSVSDSAMDGPRQIKPPPPPLPPKESKPTFNQPQQASDDSQIHRTGPGVNALAASFGRQANLEPATGAGKEKMA